MAPTFWDFSSHRQSGTARVLVMDMRHDATVSEHNKNKNEGTIDGSRRGERERTKPRARDADLWIKIWEELHCLVERCILVEVEHVKAHRTNQENTVRPKHISELIPAARKIEFESCK